MEKSTAATPGMRVLGEMTISELVYRSRNYLRLGFSVLSALLLLGGLSALIQGGAAYLASYCLIVLGLASPVAIWVFSLRRNIPLVASLAFVNLIFSALPLATGNKSLAAYSDAELIRAAGEILIFGVALSISYLVLSSTPAQRPTQYFGFSIATNASRRVILGFSLSCSLDV